ncbi:MAG: ribonuclease J [Candidatus Sericytochromatia bacterium]|nr:ribonuclease J [Candidatus Sericytochromatia bacterium]
MSNIRIIPLGGLGEIGKNCWLIESDADMVMLDCGFAFPSEEMYGVDLVIPDFTYVVERAHKLRGVFVSHGHEDHIGALPFLYRELPHPEAVPIHGTPFTMALVQRKLHEVSALRGKVPLLSCEPRTLVSAGDMTVEFIRVCHSIVDAVGFGIRTPQGMVIYSGDFKMDQTPMDGHRFDYFRFAALGEEGVLALLSDSTNAEREGITPSERVVGEGLRQAFGDAPGRVIVATFASNVQRVQQIIEVAHAYGRRVALVGRSMQQVTDQALKMGYMTVPEGALARIEDVMALPPDKVCIITTGSQGEPMSGLSRIAHGDHKHVTAFEGDTVILSAVPIPGNERSVGRTINKLFGKGVHVIYEGERSNARASRHVSGHASREELKIMLTLTKPTYFIPVHGEPRHLIHHAELAIQMGVPPQHCFIMENGAVLELGPDGGRFGDSVPSNPFLVDGQLLKDIGAAVLKDRRQLAMEGVVSVALTVDGEGHLQDLPRLLSQGFVHGNEFMKMLPDAEELIAAVLERCREEGQVGREVLKAEVSAALGRFFNERSRRRPVMLVSVLGA